MWEAIHDMYGNPNNSARIFQIQQNIANPCQDGKSFVDLLGRLKGLWNELEVYRPHSIDATVLLKRTEEDHIFQLLANLGPDFEDFRCHVLMNFELPSLKSVCASIQRGEVRRKVTFCDTTTNTPEVRAYLGHESFEQKNTKASVPI